ncbi:arylesterase [Salinicola rhizosphaerae]|uniref:Arylesterase n=2 Tax=Salinicola rhizosphaerae TaxID=1443141 RepID=A0ABQ3EBF2_9GAMM|nr:arylesterase [Salinicola rhizosphaerae]GHB25362.1 arylesterase [Salinicola rhizosphaerae]
MEPGFPEPGLTSPVARKARRTVWVLLMLCLVALSTMPGVSHASTVLVMGDSLSAAYGIDPAAGWVNLLKKRLGSEDDVVNASISGETTSGGSARLPDLLRQYHPDIVLLELGGNDGLRGLSPQQMQVNLGKMIERSQSASARVLLLGIEVPPNYGPAYTDAFRGVFTQLASDYGVPLVPFLLKGVDLDTMLQDDGIHPTAEAQPIILETVWSRLEPLLNQLDDQPG